MKQTCGNCRYWDILYIGSNNGDCRAPDNHRYSKVPMTDANGKLVSYAMMDSFGPEKTRNNDACGAWKVGQEDGVLDLSANI